VSPSSLNDSNPLIASRASIDVLVAGTELWEALLELQQTAAVKISKEMESAERARAADALRSFAPGGDQRAAALRILEEILGSLTGRQVIESGAEPGWWQPREHAYAALEALRDQVE
jgi:hypothetical protein